MRFLVDECTGPVLATWLAERGHDVFSVFDAARGADDDWVLQKACSDERILITNDKGFGEKVFRSGAPHHGVILLRLSDERSAAKTSLLERLLSTVSDRIEGAYIVANEKRVRIVEMPSGAGQKIK